MTGTHLETKEPRLWLLVQRQKGSQHSYKLYFVLRPNSELKPKELFVGESERDDS